MERGSGKWKWKVEVKSGSGNGNECLISLNFESSALAYGITNVKEMA